MDKAKAIKVLTEHNRWRRGESEYSGIGAGFPYSAKEIGEAIDIAISEMKGGENNEATPLTAEYLEEMVKHFMEKPIMEQVSPKFFDNNEFVKCCRVNRVMMKQYYEALQKKAGEA